MLNRPTFILNYPKGDIYIHTPFNSYTMLDHKRTLTQIDVLGHVVAKLTERVTLLEAALESTTTEEPDQGTIGGDQDAQGDAAPVGDGSGATVGGDTSTASKSGDKTTKAKVKGA